MRSRLEGGAKMSKEESRGESVPVKGTSLKILSIVIAVMMVSVGFTSMLDTNTRASPSADIVVFTSHPDDEALGAGGVIYEAVQDGKSAKVVVMTNGDAYQNACEAHYGKWGKDTYDRQDDVIDSPVFPKGVRLSDSWLTPGGAYYQLTIPKDANSLALKIHHYESGSLNNGIDVYVWNWVKSPQDWDYIGTTGSSGDEIWSSGPIDTSKYVSALGYVNVVVGADGWDCSDIDWVRSDCNPGSPNTAKYYIEIGKLRVDETKNAMSILGLSTSDIIFLGYPDGGLNDLWTTHTTAGNLYTSPFTDTDHSPYDNSYTPNAPYYKESVISDIKSILMNYTPGEVYIPHVSDTHNDHSTTNRFVMRALREVGMSSIPIYEYLIHWNYQDPWPEPRYENPLDNLNDHLRRPTESWTYGDPISRPLDSASISKKYDAINNYVSQINVDEKYLLSFARKNELFWEVEIEGPPLAIKIPPMIQYGEKSKTYILEFEIENRYTYPITTKLLVTESSEGFVLSHNSSTYDIEPFETMKFSFPYENEWEWVKRAGLIDFLNLGAGEVQTAADVSINKNSPLYRWLLEKDILYDHRTRNMKLASRTITVAGIVLNGIDIIMALNELQGMKSETLYTYSFDDSVTDPSQVTYHDTVEGLPNSVNVLLHVPITKQDQVVDIIWARIIATSISIAVAIIGLILTLGVASLLTSIAEGIFAVVAFILQDMAVQDPPDFNYKEIPKPSDYTPSLPSRPSPTNRLSQALNNVILESSELVSNLKAMLVAYERYQGAIIDGEYQWASTQFNAMNDFSLDVSHYILATDQQLEIVVEELDSVGYSVSKSTFDSFKNEIASELPPDEADIILQYGYSPDDFRNLLLNMNYDWVSDFHILSEFDKLAPIIPIELIEGPVGISFPDTSFPEIMPPTADAGATYVGYEGTPIQFDGTRSKAPGGTIISYEWDFNGDGIPDAFGPNPTYAWYDNIQTTATLTITAQYSVTRTDKTGKTFTYTVIRKSTSTFSVTVLNVDPIAHIDAAYMYIDFTLRGAGEKWHNIYWDLYETDEANETDRIGDGGKVGVGGIIAHLEIERYPGDPDKQSDTVYDVYIDMEKIYYFVATYNPYEDENPISGQLQGSNPCWIDLTFEDGSTERIHHNFNVQQSLIIDSDHWVHVEPWYIDLSPWFVGHVVTFEGHATDVGTDDETFTWEWGDSSPPFIKPAYKFRGASGIPDPLPSPYDVNEGNYPINVSDTSYHTYTFEGDFIVTLTVRDDDFFYCDMIEPGFDEDILDIDAIHTRYIYPRK